MSVNGVARQTESIAFFRIQSEEQLAVCWPHCKKQIEKLRHKDKSIRSWTSQSVFSAIRFGLPSANPRTTAVELHLATQEGKIMGFMVTEPLRDPFLNNIQIGTYVWILDTDFELLEKFLPELDRMTRNTGGEWIEFHTGRTGWFRSWGRMAKLGFTVQQYKISRRVPWP